MSEGQASACFVTGMSQVFSRIAFFLIVLVIVVIVKLLFIGYYFVTYIYVTVFVCQRSLGARLGRFYEVCLLMFWCVA